MNNNEYQRMRAYEEKRKFNEDCDILLKPGDENITIHISLADLKRMLLMFIRLNS